MKKFALLALVGRRYSPPMAQHQRSTTVPVLAYISDRLHEATDERRYDRERYSDYDRRHYDYDRRHNRQARSCRQGYTVQDGVLQTIPWILEPTKYEIQRPPQLAALSIPREG